MSITVAELIEELKKYPQDKIIVIRDGGDGGGFNYASGNIEEIKLSGFSVGAGSYYGEFVEYKSGHENQTYQKVGCGDTKFPLFTKFIDALLID